MTKLSESLKSLATLSGIKEDDAKLVTLLESTKNIEVDDALAATLGSSLLTMDAAKNNATLKSHFTGQSLSTADAKILEDATKHGLSEDDINELKGVKSTYDRIQKLTEIVARTIESKSGNNKTVTEKALQKLELEKAELIKQAGLKETEYNNNLAGFKSNFMLDNILASKNWILPEKLNATEKTKMAKSILASKFDELGVVLTLDNDKLIPKTKENTIYYKNNQPISTENLVDQILIENGLVKVSDAPKSRQPISQRQTNGEPPVVKFVKDDFMEAELERQISQL